MNLDVYDTANGTHLGTLSQVYNISFMDDLTIPGFASFQVDVASTADLALLAPRRIVRFRTGASAGTGDVFACIVQDRPAELVADIEPASGDAVTVVTFECPGLLSWLGNAQGGAVLYPYGGMGGRQQNPRMFGWFSPDYDDTDWGPVSGPDRVQGPLSTVGWPDELAVGYQTVFPGDRALYRRTLESSPELAGPARMYIVATVLTSVTVWLDNDIVLEKPAGRSGLFFADIDYEGQDHQIAVEVKGGRGRWGFTWMRLVPTEDATILDWQRDFFDDSDWLTPEVDDRPAVMAFQGAWDSGTAYSELDGVEHTGDTWLALEATTAGQEPGVSAKWVLGESVTTAGWPDEDAIAYAIDRQSVQFRRALPGAGTGAARMYLVATSQTDVTVYVDGTEVIAKPAGTVGIQEAEVSYPADDAQLSVAIEGEGRWAFVWRGAADGSGATLLSTYDPDGASPSNPWLFRVTPTRGDEFQLGTVLRRTFDPDVFPAATPWKSFEGGPIDWTFAGFDDSDWAGPIADGPLTTPDWPDSLAVGYAAPTDRMRYRRTMAGAAIGDDPQTMYVVATYQTAVFVFLDGVRVLTKPAGARGVFSAEVPYSTADRQLAVLVCGGGRWGWTWRDGLDATIRRTFDPAVTSASEPWTALPDPVPGVTVGLPLKVGIDEAQARGLLPDLTYDFDGAADSGLTPWVREFTRGFRVQELGRLLDELVSIEGEPEMTPAGLLRYWSKRGTDRTATVTIDAPFSLGLTGRGPQATRWLFETEGGFGQIVNQAAEDTLGVVLEQFVQLGNDVEPDAIQPSLVRQLARDGAATDDGEVHLPDDVVPYDDVFLGDLVTADARDGSTRTVRLTQFEYSLTDAGEEVWVASVDEDL